MRFLVGDVAFTVLAFVFGYLTITTGRTDYAILMSTCWLTSEVYSTRRQITKERLST